MLRMGYFKGKSSKGFKLSRVKRSTYLTVKNRKSIDMSPRPSPCAKRGKLSYTPSPRKKNLKRPILTPTKSARKQITFQSPHKLTPYKVKKRLCISWPLKGRHKNSFSACTIRTQISHERLPYSIEHDSRHKYSSSDILDDLDCTEILNTDEQGIITKVRDTAIRTVAATDEEEETCYEQTGFKMPPEILDDINCSVILIPSEQESHDRHRTLIRSSVTAKNLPLNVKVMILSVRNTLVMIYRIVQNKL